MTYLLARPATYTAVAGTVSWAEALCGRRAATSLDPCLRVELVSVAPFLGAGNTGVAARLGRVAFVASVATVSYRIELPIGVEFPLGTRVAVRVTPLRFVTPRGTRLAILPRDGGTSVDPGAVDPGAVDIGPDTRRRDFRIRAVAG